MINIFSFKKDEAKTQKYQAKYEKISNTKEDSIQNKTEGIGLTIELFNKVETGMSLKDVKKLLIIEPKLTTKSNIGGEIYEVYEWTENDNNNIKTIIINFDNGKVTTKSQFGL
jgi:hypothetical protein